MVNTAAAASHKERVRKSIDGNRMADNDVPHINNANIANCRTTNNIDLYFPIFKNYS